MTTMDETSMQDRISCIYEEEIKKQGHRLAHRIIRRIKDLTGKKLKLESVRRQICRMKEKQCKFNSYDDRRKGGVCHVLTAETIAKGVDFYNMNKNKNIADFDNKLSKFTGVPQTSGTWYRFKKAISEQMSKSQRQQSNKSGCCQVCNGAVKSALYPAFKCSRCGELAHLFCDAVATYFIPKDVFSGIDKSKQNLKNFRKEVICKLQKDYVCCACLNGTHTKLKTPYEKPDGSEVHSIEVVYQKGVSIRVVERDVNGRVIKRKKDTYKVRKSVKDPIKIERVEVTNYTIDEIKFQQSVNEFRKHSCYKSGEKHDPKCYMYIFSDSGVPTGCRIIVGGLTKSERDWIKSELHYVHYQPGDSRLPKFFEIPNAANFGNKRRKKQLWDRLKLYFGFWYTYGGSKMELNKNDLSPSRCSIFRFIKLRNQGLWKGMYCPNMMQINSYHRNKGIQFHFDEVVWFPAPVHTTRIGGFANLHFGLDGRASTPYQNLSELFIQIKDSEFFQMSGIFQILYTHGIARGKSHLSEETITILLRKANKNACGASLNKSLI